MINKKAKLNPKIFEADVEKSPIRDGFRNGLLKAGELDKNVVALTADLNESVRTDKFAEKFPERFFEVGIAEQNLVSVASGLAHLGKIPFAASYAVFHPGRSWEQIRTTVCYNNQPVKIVGSHAGLTTGPDGGTHQALEDIAITRVLPNMYVVVPCDSIEAEKATLEMAGFDFAGEKHEDQTARKTPCYLRLGREKTPIITTKETPFKIGQAELLYEPNDDKIDVGIIACGVMVHPAIFAAQELFEKNINVSVLNLHTIKPIDRKAVVDLAKKTGAILTVEEHQVAGGAGSAVAEVLASEYPVPIEFLGVKDKFGESGSGTELLNHHNLNKDGIIKGVKKLLAKKLEL